MTDETQLQIPQAEEHPLVQPEIIPAVPRKTNWLPWMIACGVGLFVCLCCAACLVLAAAGVAAGAGKMLVEKGPVETVLKSFMEDMQAKDTKAAYALFSPRSRRSTPITDLEKMLSGNNYVLFDGYRNLTVQNLNLTATVNTNPEMPQGTVANVSGTITYQGDYIGRFTAVLEKVDGQWKIYNINITVPPDKSNL